MVTTAQKPEASEVARFREALADAESAPSLYAIGLDVVDSLEAAASSLAAALDRLRAKVVEITECLPEDVFKENEPALFARLELEVNAEWERANMAEARVAELEDERNVAQRLLGEHIQANKELERERDDWKARAERLDSDLESVAKDPASELFANQTDAGGKAMLRMRAVLTESDAAVRRADSLNALLSVAETNRDGWQSKAERLADQLASERAGRERLATQLAECADLFESRGQHGLAQQYRSGLSQEFLKRFREGYPPTPAPPSEDEDGHEDDTEEEAAVGPSEANTLSVMRVADGKVVASEVHHGGAGGGDEDGYDMTGLNGGPTHRDVRNWAEASGLPPVLKRSLVAYADRCEQAEKAPSEDPASPVECRCRRAAMGSTRCEECEHDLSCPRHMAHKEGPASPVAEVETPEQRAEAYKEAWCQACGERERLRDQLHVAETEAEIRRLALLDANDKLRAQAAEREALFVRIELLANRLRRGGYHAFSGQVRALRSQPTPTGEAKDSSPSGSDVTPNSGGPVHVQGVITTTDGAGDSPVAPAAKAVVAEFVAERQEQLSEAYDAPLRREALRAQAANMVLAVLTETRPGNVRLNALDTLTRALKVTQADAQALADMRTLDACGMRHATVDYRGPGTPGESTAERWRCEVGTQAAFDAPTPDAARAKAAAWVRAREGLK